MIEQIHELPEPPSGYQSWLAQAREAAEMIVRNHAGRKGVESLKQMLAESFLAGAESHAQRTAREFDVERECCPRCRRQLKCPDKDCGWPR